jgi:menaquinone-9 beta-reductase
METCDVAIVGGGPAGSSCAWRLRRSGCDVVVVDKARFPRDKVCAGWITPAVVEELQLDLDDYRRERVLQPITGFLTSLLGGREVRTDFGRTVSYGIRRCEFDHYLLERCGARLLLGHPLKSLRRDGDDWIINEELRAPLLVGAGGHFCPVARQTTAEPEQPETVVMAQEIEFEMSPAELQSCKIDAQVPELFFCPDLKGYAWCFRKGNVMNIGLGRENETRLTEHVQDFCAYLAQQRKIDLAPEHRFHGHAYRLHLHAPRRLLFDRVLLIGDAAGLAYAQSGEGIRPAIESGLLAAEVILESAESEKSSLARKLDQRLQTRFGNPRVGRLVPAVVPAAVRRQVASYLLGTKWFAQKVLLERWFLHLQDRPLGI